MPDKKPTVRRTKQPKPKTIPDRPTVSLDPETGLFIGTFAHYSKTLGSPNDLSEQQALVNFTEYCIRKGVYKP